MFKASLAGWTNSASAAETAFCAQCRSLHTSRRGTNRKFDAAIAGDRRPSRCGGCAVRGWHRLAAVWSWGQAAVGACCSTPRAQAIWPGAEHCHRRNSCKLQAKQSPADQPMQTDPRPLWSSTLRLLVCQSLERFELERAGNDIPVCALPAHGIRTSRCNFAARCSRPSTAPQWKQSGFTDAASEAKVSGTSPMK